MDSIRILRSAGAVQSAVSDGIAAADVGAVIDLDALQHAVVDCEVDAFKIGLGGI